MDFAQNFTNERQNPTTCYYEIFFLFLWINFWNIIPNKTDAFFGGVTDVYKPIFLLSIFSILSVSNVSGDFEFVAFWKPVYWKEFRSLTILQVVNLWSANSIMMKMLAYALISFTLVFLKKKKKKKKGL